MKLIHIGRKFYWESGSAMSSLYQPDGDSYLRSDWGKVEVALERGEAVSIRPATDAEFRLFQQKLDALNERRTKEAAKEGGER